MSSRRCAPAHSWLGGAQLAGHCTAGGSAQLEAVHSSWGGSAQLGKQCTAAGEALHSRGAVRSWGSRYGAVNTTHPSPLPPPQAVAWRVTPGGRSLIDRRRRSRVERNVRLVVEHLELECGVPFGEPGVENPLARGCSMCWLLAAGAWRSVPPVIALLVSMPAAAGWAGSPLHACGNSAQPGGVLRRVR